GPRGRRRRCAYHGVGGVGGGGSGGGAAGRPGPRRAPGRGSPAERVSRPRNDHPLYRPATKRTTALSDSYRAAIDPARFHLPECERAHAEVVSFHHRLLLGDERDMDDVIRAFRKAWEHLR